MINEDDLRQSLKLYLVTDSDILKERDARKNDNIILHIFHLPITGNGKINFSFFHTTLF